MRNEDTHFSVNPVNIDIGRSRFEMPCNVKTTFDTGEIVPFFWTEILPGDTVSMQTSKVIRQSTLLDPVMDNMYLDTYWFFVPMRLTWEHSKEFFGENTSGPWAPSVSYTVPQIAIKTPVPVGGLLDYMGVPVGANNISVSALPIRAYNIVYRDWFMSEAVQTPPNLYVGDSTVDYDLSNYMDPVAGGNPYKACKLHDYFTSCLPAPQRGDPVSINVASSASVSIPAQTLNVTGASTLHAMANTINFSSTNNSNVGGQIQLTVDNDDRVMLAGTPPITHAGSGPANRSNLIVNVPATSEIPITGINSITVNELRLAFQMQKWLEKSALYGGRYVEMLKAQFGVTSPDARLQRSEYLGGNRIPINVHQVEQSVPTDGAPLAHLGAYSATSDNHNDFTHSFTEHGFLIGVCVARYRHSYPQGLSRMWSRKSMYDYYFPVFASIGNQPVLKKEILCNGEEEDNDVFGYQEAWAEYRTLPDRCSGYMRPGIDGSLSSWHYADHYTEHPTLSDDWIVEDKSIVDRTLAVTSKWSDQWIADILCNGVFVRPMPMYSIPGLIDHH